jgi:two-component sensor histidine kinase
VISDRFVRAFEVLQEHVQRLALRQPSAPEQGPIAEINAMDETLYLVGDQLAQVLHRQELLLAEINHRVKNTLATVNAIARLSRTSAANVPEIFALGRAYDLPTQSDWSGVDLYSLVQTTIAPYAQSRRITCRGPARSCGPNSRWRWRPRSKS